MTSCCNTTILLSCDTNLLNSWAYTAFILSYGVFGEVFILSALHATNVSTVRTASSTSQCARGAQNLAPQHGERICAMLVCIGNTNPCNRKPREKSTELKDSQETPSSERKRWQSESKSKVSHSVQRSLRRQHQSFKACVPSAS